MIRNYLKTALRNLWRHKSFSAINIAGLAVSMSVCLLILSMIAGLMSYDDFHVNGERIYRVLSKRAQGGSWNATSVMPLGEELEDHYPGVEAVATLRAGIGGDASQGETVVALSGLYADGDFFRFFDFPVLHGNPETALQEPFSMVLSRASAEKLFGTIDVVGRTLHFSDRGMMPIGVGLRSKPEDYGEFKVTAVLDKMPGHSHLVFDFLASFQTLYSLESRGVEQTLSGDWNNIWQTYQYVMLDDAYDGNYLQSALDKLALAHYPEERDFRAQFRAQALGAITPGKLISNSLKFTLPLEALYFLAVLALVVILSACFNYTNLSMARSLNRSKEIGIRKAAGAVRRQIMVQFMGEAVVVALFALLLASGIYALLKPAFASLWLNQYIAIPFAEDMSILLWFTLFAVLVGCLAGLLPSIYLSAFRPIAALKNPGSEKLVRRITLRKTLITAQFVLSLVFILSAILLRAQLRHLLELEYGFNSERILNVRLQGHDHRKFIRAFGDHSGVERISGSGFLPATGFKSGTTIRGAEQPGDSIYVDQLFCDAGFLESLELRFIAGKAFPADLPDDSDHYLILNRRAIEELGFGQPALAIGRTFTAGDQNQLLEVTGVVEDFRTGIMIEKDGSFAIRYRPADFIYANIKLIPGREEDVLAHLQKVWRQFDPLHSLDYRFFNHQLDESHAVLGDIGYVVGFVAALAVLISCMGLLGIAAFTSESRVKEIGIRKILGAGVGQLILLLSGSYGVLIGIAVSIAIPLSVSINNLWLREFPDRVEFGPGIIGIGVALLLALAAAAVLSQTWRVSRTNPADILRCD
jgi:putative ABC transport system permease protein